MDLSEAAPPSALQVVVQAVEVLMQGPSTHKVCGDWKKGYSADK
jgi:hypothetical protein